MSSSTTHIAVFTALIGGPIFLVFWWFFAARSLFVAGKEELEDPARQGQGHESSAFIYLRGISESWFCATVLASVIVPARAKVVEMVDFLIKNNPKQYVKIIVSFYQESTARCVGPSARRAPLPSHTIDWTCVCQCYSNDHCV
jgi:hypothetical protein